MRPIAGLPAQVLALSRIFSLAKILRVIPGDEAYLPLSRSTCPLVKKVLTFTPDSEGSAMGGPGIPICPWRLPRPYPRGPSADRGHGRLALCRTRPPAPRRQRPSLRLQYE